MVKNLYLLLLFLVLGNVIYSQDGCDYTYSGPVLNGKVIKSGEFGCIVGNYQGAITVRDGGTVRICGSYVNDGSLTI